MLLEDAPTRLIRPIPLDEMPTEIAPPHACEAFPSWAAPTYIRPPERSAPSDLFAWILSSALLTSLAILLAAKL